MEKAGMRAAVFIPAGTRIPSCSSIRFRGALRENRQGVLSRLSVLSTVVKNARLCVLCVLCG